MNTIKPEARLVHQGWAKCAGFIQSEYLPVRLASIAKSGNVITLQGGFAAPVPLKRIIAMQPVLAAKVVTDVSGPLINIHWRCSRSAAQPGRGSRDQGKQLLNDWIGNRCPLRVGGHGDRRQREALTLTQPLIAEKEECLVPAFVTKGRATFAKVWQV